MKPIHNHVSVTCAGQTTSDILILFPAIETLRPFLISNDSLKTFDTVTVPITTEMWASFALLGMVKHLKQCQLERDGISEMVELEADDLTTGYFFETHEGVRGLMAFEGFARNPCRVKLRYKLAQNVEESRRELQEFTRFETYETRNRSMRRET